MSPGSRCARCSALLPEIIEVNQLLRNLLVPALVGITPRAFLSAPLRWPWSDGSKSRRTTLASSAAASVLVIAAIAAALLIGAHELIAMKETPYRVAINESIELGKVFGGTDGHKYVNGILDRLAATVRTEEIAFQSGGEVPARAKAPRKTAPVVVKKTRKVAK